DARIRWPPRWRWRWRRRWCWCGRRAPWWWRHIDCATMIVVRQFRVRLDDRRRADAVQQNPLVRMNAFRIARMFLQVLEERTLLRFEVRLRVRNKHLQDRPRARPLSRLHAPLPLGLKLS